ncbi:MAG: DUF1801 domain-containing protein [Gammaproteobacteria bacterium]|nr:DUF1801 domain-containing protein [Gammaproteobacteria bacterium]
MAELKTKKNDGDVTGFLNQVGNEKRRADAFTVLEMMAEITAEKPVMWGTSIIGFGNYHYTYASGREGDWFLTGLSPRKQALTLYIISGFGKYDGLMKKLGKYKIGKSCLYINKLEDVDLDVLRDLISESVRYLHETYPEPSA